MFIEQLSNNPLSLSTLLYFLSYALSTCGASTGFGPNSRVAWQYIAIDLSISAAQQFIK